MLSTKIHGYMDYLMGLLLILSPLIFTLPAGAASTVPIVLGAGVIVYSLITDYELGLLKILPMSTHLVIDIIAGVVLTASPWIFGFAAEVYLPHVILGVLEVGAGIFTEKHPSYQEAPKP